MAIAGVAVAVFIATLWGTGRIREYAIQRRVLDIPNQRSSHSRPTPRGGGVAVVLATVVALPCLAMLGLIPWRLALAFAGPGALVGAIGLADDAGHVEPRWRLLGHFIAAGCVLAALGGMPPLSVLGRPVDLGPAGLALGALYLVWMLNLTNFMDGIDGLAALEAITVSLAGATIHVVAMPDGVEWAPALVLAAAAAGFLAWNWPPAKIFMGDAGSGFLGLLLGSLALRAGWVGAALFWSWTILLGVFVVDATVTLLRRLARRQRLHEAHRSHAYQRAALRWGHRPVTTAVGLINLCWLTPIAFVVALGRLDGAVATAIAFAPLAAAALWMKAGRDTI